MQIQNSRIIIKRADVSGIVPSIPTSDNHTDGTWTSTDIYKGEFFINTEDERLWYRSEHGIVEVTAGATGTPITDYVSASLGGTFSGSIDIIGDLDVDGQINATGDVVATGFYGDGSGLTNINATWAGGTVANFSIFENIVEFQDLVKLNTLQALSGTNINVTSNLDVTGSVTATTFYGDGSNLSNLPSGQNYYTTAANLTGNILSFDRTDTNNAYSVDLSGLAASNAIAFTNWDSINNELEITLNDGTIIVQPIDTFTDLTVNGTITADHFVGDGSGLYNLSVVGVTGATGPMPGATNGLSVYGAEMGLGGTLTIPTTINGNNQTLDIGASGSELSFLRVKSIQAQEEYKFAGDGLEVLKNPGTFKTTIDYEASTGLKTVVGQFPNTFYTLVSSQGGTSVSQIIQLPGTIQLLATSNSNSYPGSGFVLDDNANSFRFADQRPSPKGLEYDSDYSAGYTPLSLITKGDLDNVTLISGNGITIGASGSIDLGGTLTQDTIINGNGKDFELGATGSEIDFLRIKALQAQEEYKFGGEGLSLIKNPGTYFRDMDYTASLDRRSFTEQSVSTISSVVNTNSAYEQTQITQTPHEINILVRVNGADDSGFVLNQQTDNFSFVDKRLTPKGLEYSDDYSANFSIRSLVDKEYVDSAISGATFNLIDDTTPQLGGNLDLNNFNIGGTGNIDITGNVISDIVQLRGGVGTQGEMSWSTDEETVQLIMDGTTLHIGQDTFVHARNNTASIITKGTAVYATGTLGASGRVTIAPMIADGTIPGRYFIGLAAEDIAIGADGQVMTFGKIRQINTNAYTDGDVLWLSPTVAGQLTTTEPTAPNLKIATAFVIHAANNGTLMVRAEQGNDLHSDQRVQVSGLTDGDVLTWSNANQRWENEQPIDTNFANTDLTLTGNRTHELSGNTLNFSNSATNFLRLNTFNEIFTFGKGDTTNLYFGNNVLRNVTSGLQNVIVGNDINGITTGQVNTFVGFRAGQNLNNSGNSFFGGFAGYTLTSGANNVIIGRSAAFSTNAGGTVSNLENSIVIGETARVLNSGDVNTIVIGRNSRGLGSNTVVIGNSDITRTQLRGRVEMDTTTDGILMPRLTTAQMNAIVSPATNLLVFNTDLNGLYRYNGSAWVALSTGYGIISVNNSSGAPTYYATFKSAVDAIGGNGVVNLHSNISVTAVGEMPTIGTNDTLTINGNGYTITHTCNSGSDFHLVDCTSNTAKIYLNNVKIVSNGTASGSYVASVFGGITNSPSLIELSSDSIITTTNNGIREFGTIRGGTLICSNGLIAIATTIKNAEVTTKYASASMFNCNVTVVSGGYIGSGGAYEINGCNITGDATSVTPIRLEPNAKFWNNNVVITTGGQDAIYIQSGTPDKWININNCYIRHLGTGRGIFGEYVSEIHNTTVYAESNVACYTQQGYPTYAYNGATIKNCTFITNSTAHSAYSSLNVNTRKLQNVTAVCRNTANTQPAFSINMGYSSAILTVTDCEAIVNNASAYNFQTTGSVSGAYIYGLKMSVIGLGMDLSTTLLNTNTMDAFGNIKLG